MTEDEFRSLVCGLPEVAERPHHGFPSWRVGSRVVATSPEPGLVNVMAGEEAINAAVGEFPDWCRERWWGERLAAVTVRVEAADPDVLHELVVDAWRNTAPASVVRAHPELG